tara:strand:- start:19 stop:531 length:513 start_codon:yes stop_codon:yes gene_type:complete
MTHAGKAKLEIGNIRREALALAAADRAARQQDERERALRKRQLRARIFSELLCRLLGWTPEHRWDADEVTLDGITFSLIDLSDDDLYKHSSIDLAAEVTGEDACSCREYWGDWHLAGAIRGSVICTSEIALDHDFEHEVQLREFSDLSSLGYALERASCFECSAMRDKHV